jgi:hypothetical protein
VAFLLMPIACGESNETSSPIALVTVCCSLLTGSLTSFVSKPQRVALATDGYKKYLLLMPNFP